MSGVNAHALFTTTPATSGDAAQPVPPSALPFRRARHWALPRPHHLLGRASHGRGATVTFSCRLCRSELGYLWHHQVSNVLTGNSRTIVQLKVLQS
jgi:hypothetical protein